VRGEAGSVGALDGLAPSAREADIRSERHEQGEKSRPRVPPSPSPCAPPCFLDQRLDESLELLAIDRIARARRARRRSCLPPLLCCASVTSIILNVKVDKGDPTDLYEQVAGEIRRAIADGEAKPGERLPPAKDLAAVLGVNTNTVLRSLRVLRDEGLLEFRRGRGISVAGTPERGAVVQRTRELVEFARHHGYRLDELVEIIEDVG
jgi:GntR family transcriptional regulator